MTRMLTNIHIHFYLLLHFCCFKMTIVKTWNTSWKKKKNKQKVIIDWIKMHESDGFGKYCRALFIKLISQHLAVRTCSASLNDLDLSQYGLSYEKKIKIRGGRSERAHYWLFQIKDLDLLVFIAWIHREIGFMVGDEEISEIILFPLP